MKKYQINGVLPLDSNGMLSTDFVEQSGLRVRVLAGTPTILELGIISSALRTRDKATFELFEDDLSLSRSYEVEPTVSALVCLMHEKFAKTALVRSTSNSEIAYFDYSNDYFLFLAEDKILNSIFHLDRDQMADYFNDTIEGGDKDYLSSIWTRYESFM